MPSHYVNQCWLVNQDVVILFKKMNLKIQPLKRLSFIGSNVLITTVCSPALYKTMIFVWAICPGFGLISAPMGLLIPDGSPYCHTKEVYKSSAYSLLGQQFNRATLPHSTALNTSNTMHRPLYFLHVTRYGYLNICDFMNTGNTICSQLYFCPWLDMSLWMIMI